jgi:hypothetical protein
MSDQAEPGADNNGREGSKADVNAARCTDSAEVDRMKQSQQTTLRSAITLEGCGVHSGDDVRIVSIPPKANHGIVFLEQAFPTARDR